MGKLEVLRNLGLFQDEAAAALAWDIAARQIWSAETLVHTHTDPPSPPRCVWIFLK